MKRKVALALVAAFVVAMPMFAGHAEKAENSETTVLAIKGMTCGGCTGKVKAKLAETEGVIAFEVSLEDKQAKVEYNPEKTSPEDIVKAVSTTGFQVEVKDKKDSDKA